MHRKIKHRALSAALSAVLIIVMLTANVTAASGLTDISGHWAQKEIEYWVDKDVIHGYEDNTFRPDNAISRAEAATLAVNRFGLGSVKSDIVYKDVRDSLYAAKAIGICGTYGFFKGYEDGMFRPSANITRQEAMLVIFRMTSFDSSSSQEALNRFADRSKVASWAAAAVGTLADAGLVRGYGDGTIRPTAQISRAEFVTLLYRVEELGRWKTPEPVCSLVCTLNDADKTVVPMTYYSGVNNLYLPLDADLSSLKIGDANDSADVTICISGDKGSSAESKGSADINLPAIASKGSDDVYNLNVKVTENGRSTEYKVSAIQALDYRSVNPVINDKIRSMSLHELVSQMFIATPEALTGVDQVTGAGAATRSAIAETPVGGLVYFAGNLQSASQTGSMILNTQTYSQELTGMKMFISVDEEGGRVTRVSRKLGTTEFDPMYNYRAYGPVRARSNAKTIAGDIRSFGFNLDFAPVADTWSNPQNSIIGDRAYSDDFNQAAELVSSAVGGFHEGGSMCVIKHFPGHGDTVEDSHAGSAFVYKSLAQMKNEELVPFASGIASGADMVMVGHITVPEVDSMPASISKTWVTDVLRGQMHYDDVVITDSLLMGAVSSKYTQAEIVVMAVNAGDDILLVQSDLQSSAAAVEQAVNSGGISKARIQKSVYRILDLKRRNGLL